MRSTPRNTKRFLPGSAKPAEQALFRRTASRARRTLSAVAAIATRAMARTRTSARTRRTRRITTKNRTARSARRILSAPRATATRVTALSRTSARTTSQTASLAARTRTAPRATATRAPATTRTSARPRRVPRRSTRRPPTLRPARRISCSSSWTALKAGMASAYNTRPVTFTAARAARVTVAPSCTRYAASPQQVPSPPHRRAANE